MGESAVSLLTLNIERSKHLERILPFLAQRMPDVSCIQELRESDVPYFEEVLGTRCVFEPMVLHEDDGVFNVVGIGLFSRLPLKTSHTLYYVGEPGVLKKYVGGDQGLFNRLVLLADVEKGSRLFRIGATHFTWTPDGEANDTQRNDLKRMLQLLEPHGEHVLCGDFNAPRGREIFSVLSERYTDNVPREYTTSLDQELHRAKGLEYMVDGIFSTGGYKVQNVTMYCGLSDHCGFLSEVTHS